MFLYGTCTKPKTSIYSRTKSSTQSKEFILDHFLTYLYTFILSTPGWTLWCESKRKHCSDKSRFPWIAANSLGIIGHCPWQCWQVMGVSPPSTCLSWAPPLCLGHRLLNIYIYIKKPYCCQHRVLMHAPVGTQVVIWKLKPVNQSAHYSAFQQGAFTFG